ncbi:conserved Plasmodium protein, unknown function [Plasmodium gallinaceum]|uniref:Uncharacterized protein n=1 Tax=Plasmodium gallinaceum TaxID=5849 RepID=A0A1J1GRW5_PLAGA|nr:conserved Plasmodium protein, unknown function [Plasmodium gallinaceum]CRG93778.1 conserved Plasmodium protein, unknown function [Plasmodium gallinaceum]
MYYLLLLFLSYFFIKSEVLSENNHHYNKEYHVNPNIPTTQNYLRDAEKFSEVKGKILDINYVLDKEETPFNKEKEQNVSLAHTQINNSGISKNLKQKNERNPEKVSVENRKLQDNITSEQIDRKIQKRDVQQILQKVHGEKIENVHEKSKQLEKGNSMQKDKENEKVTSNPQVRLTELIKKIDKKNFSEVLGEILREMNEKNIKYMNKETQEEVKKKIQELMNNDDIQDSDKRNLEDMYTEIFKKISTYESEEMYKQGLNQIFEEMLRELNGIKLEEINEKEPKGPMEIPKELKKRPGDEVKLQNLDEDKLKETHIKGLTNANAKNLGYSKNCSKYSYNCEDAQIHSLMGIPQEREAYENYIKFIEMSNELSTKHDFYDEFVENLFSVYNSYFNITNDNFNVGSISLFLSFKKSEKELSIADFHLSLYGNIKNNNGLGSTHLATRHDVKLNLYELILQNKINYPNLPGKKVIKCDNAGTKELHEDKTGDSEDTKSKSDYSNDDNVCNAIHRSNINPMGEFFTLNRSNDELYVSGLYDFLDKCFIKSTKNTNDEEQKNSEKKDDEDEDEDEDKEAKKDRLFGELKESIVNKDLEKCKMSFETLKAYSSGFSHILSFFTLMIIIIYICL